MSADMLILWLPDALFALPQKVASFPFLLLPFPALPFPSLPFPSLPFPSLPFPVRQLCFIS